MLLSIQQRYILETVQTLGYIQRRQLHILTQRKFQATGYRISEAAMNAMLRQLRACQQDIRLDGLGVWIAGFQPTPLHLEAVDVMLELSGDIPAEFHLGASTPILLRFTLDEPKVRLFTVAELSVNTPVTLERQRMERIVWISEGGCAPPGLTLPPKHFFAARQSDGSHRFYGSEEP